MPHPAIVASSGVSGLRNATMASGLSGATLDLILAEHGSAAFWRATMAVGVISVVGVMKIVLIGQLLARSDVAGRDHPNAAVEVLCLAVWIAAVVDEHRRPEAVYHLTTISGAEQIGDKAVLVPLIGLILREARPVVLDDRGAFSDRPHGVAASGVYGRRTNYKPRKHPVIIQNERIWVTDGKGDVEQPPFQHPSVSADYNKQRIN